MERGGEKHRAQRCSLNRLPIETLPEVGRPTVGLGRVERPGKEAKSNGRHDHNQSHRSSQTVRHRDLRPLVGSSRKISAGRWWGARPRTSWRRVHSPCRQHQREQRGRSELIRWSSWLLLQAMQTALLLSASMSRMTRCHQRRCRVRDSLRNNFSNLVLCGPPPNEGSLIWWKE